MSRKRVLDAGPLDLTWSFRGPPAVEVLIHARAHERNEPVQTYRFRFLLGRPVDAPPLHEGRGKHDLYVRYDWPATSWIRDPWNDAAKASGYACVGDYMYAVLNRGSAPPPLPVWQIVKSP